MKLTTTIGVLSVIVSAQGWAFSPKQANMIGRKAFLAGAAGAAVVRTATAAGVAIAIWLGVGGPQ
jgi:hypothetical protein